MTPKAVDEAVERVRSLTRDDLSQIIQATMGWARRQRADMIADVVIAALSASTTDSGKAREPQPKDTK